MPDELAAQLQAWADAHYGPGAKVSDVTTMPGHSGLSFGFSLRSGAVLDELVIRVPPKGVRRSGNTDVLRQVPLLQALARDGVPVPPVRWWGEDETWFGVPYVMVDRLPGCTLNIREPDPSLPQDEEGVAELVAQAVEALAQVHRIDWKTELAGWADPRSLDEEIRFWDRILAKAAEPGWVTLGEEVRGLLLDALPADPPIGLFHGDFQTNNMLFDGARLVAVLDWEISGIGGRLLDLGWLLMMTDAASWHDGRGSLALAPDAADVVAQYEEDMREPTHDVAWYRALAGYRFGVITCFNVMLHRTGKRPDPEWDVIALSVEPLFGRAAELLRGATE